MSEAALEAIRNVLRDLGPLSTGEIVAELTARKQIKSKNPPEYVRSAVFYRRSIVAVGKGKARKYVELPSFIRGAAMRLPVPAERPKAGRIIVSSELISFLWPGDDYAAPRPVKLALAGGRTAKLSPATGALSLPYHFAEQVFPDGFWTWWAEQRKAGHDELEIRCEDGEEGRYSAQGVTRSELDANALAASNRTLIEKAVPQAADVRATEWPEFTRRVIGTGAFHQDPTSDRLTLALFDPPGRFVLEGSRIRSRDDLTPAILRVLSGRIVIPGSEDDWVLRMYTKTDSAEPATGGLGFGEFAWVLAEDEVEVVDDAATEKSQPVLDSEDQYLAPIRPQPGEQIVRITVILEWLPDVWRTVEVLQSQTHEDLHRVIQRAFGWEDDHLWEFVLSGERHDSVTRIAMPQGFTFPEYDPPTADEVTIGELELQPKQRLFYLFDFGDNLGHNLRVEGTFEPDPEALYPRVVEVHGEAPKQYPDYEEDWGEEDDEEGESNEP